MSKRLYFKNNVMHTGLNYTVRLGRKWFDRVQLGEEVIILTTGAEPITNLTPEARIVDAITGAYRDIPPFVLEKEHDPDCHNFAGLDKAMKRAYPDWTGDPKTLVTCLGFVIDE